MHEKKLDVSKLKFSIAAMYDCDEGIDCGKSIEMGSYEDAVSLADSLESPTWIDHYYHRMTLSVDVYGEDGKRLDLTKILDGEYSDFNDECYASSKSAASELPGLLSEFLAGLAQDCEERNAEKIAKLKEKIASLKAELAEAEEELSCLQESKV